MEGFSRGKESCGKDSTLEDTKPGREEECSREFFLVVINQEQVCSSGHSIFFTLVLMGDQYKSLRLYRFKVDQCVPFCINFADFHAKMDNLINFKSK